MCRSSTTTVSGRSSTAVVAAAPSAPVSLPAITLLGRPEDEEREAQEDRGPQNPSQPHERSGVVAAEQRLPHQRDVDAERVDLHEEEQHMVGGELVDDVKDPRQVEQQARHERDQLREVTYGRCSSARDERQAEV